MSITAPYNFVPLNNYVYIPSWQGQVSMDKPFADGEDGVIEVTIHTESPLFTRNGSGSDKDEYSAHIVGTDGQKHYFIPGTSLKGMLVSVMEIMSFGRMDNYNNDSFGYRIFDRREKGGREYAKLMEKVKCGWLRMDDTDLFLAPCDGDYERITHSEIKKRFHRFNPQDTADNKQKIVKSEGGLYPLINGMRLVCTGPMNNKKNEYLFPVDTLAEVQIDNDVRDAFLSVHKPTPLFETYYHPLLKKGEQIPVFYLKSDGKVSCIGLSRMMRVPYRSNVEKAVKQEKSDGQDLCHTIFGYAGKDDSLRGRVQISMAWNKDNISDEQLVKVQGVQGKPSASYYPLYLRQDGPQYKTYDDDKAVIAGRKRYRIHKYGTTTSLPQGNGNERVVTTFRALPAGKDFTFRINVHNLRPVETGAILSALTFHGTAGCWHNIGLAKSFGYGKISCAVDCLKGLSKKADEYMRLFEEEMSAFTYEKTQTLWTDTEQIRSLLAIATEHDDKDLTMMELQDYADNKKKFSRLTENNLSVKSLSPGIMTRIRLKDYAADIKKADELVDHENYAEALAIYRRIEDELQYRGISSQEINDKITNAEKRKEEERVAQEESRQQKEAEIRELRQKAGLSMLMEKNSNGEYKVKDWNGAKNRIEQWMKKEGLQSLPTDQHHFIIEWLPIAYANLKPREKRLWDDCDNSMWKILQSWTNVPATEWYNKIHNPS